MKEQKNQPYRRTVEDRGFAATRAMKAARKAIAYKQLPGLVAVAATYGLSLTISQVCDFHFMLQPIGRLPGWVLHLWPTVQTWRLDGSLIPLVFSDDWDLDEVVQSVGADYLARSSDRVDA